MRKRHFVRFGEIPEGKRSTLWNAPNIFFSGQVGATLPGLSAYSVLRRGEKWELDTESINVGSGMASLMALFDRTHTDLNELPIYLLHGVATTWRSLTADERDQFKEWYPGRGRERLQILGTDGEPLVRDFEIVSKLNVADLVCKMINYPDDWQDEQFAIPAALSSPSRI
jgi:hypothetical protein